MDELEGITLPDLPPTADCMAALPEWFQRTFASLSDFEEWKWMVCDAREWVWWSGAVVGDRVKIDLEIEAWPNSTVMLTRVVEAAGGTIIYFDSWLDVAGSTAPVEDG